MLRENHTAVIARNEPWAGAIATEPYEAGWATEAVIFIRALQITKPMRVEARVQMSADGIRWFDEGTVFGLPDSIDADTCARISRFGNWVRIVADLPPGVSMKALVTLHLK